MTRALIVYSRVGGGHQSAASALVEAFRRHPEGPMVAHMVDVYRECSRFPLTRVPALYAWLARGHPRLWAALFHATRWGGDVGLALVPWMLPGLLRRLERERPDVLVSVLPVVNTTLGIAVRRSALGIRLEVVLTDWASIHRSWVGQGVDRYLVPTHRAAEDLQRVGVPPDCVETVGIPVRHEFGQQAASPMERQRLRAELGLAPQSPLVLVMVGAEGSPSGLRFVHALSAVPAPAQFVVVCGRNETLRLRVRSLRWESPVRVLGFSDDIPRLMRASDLLVTKAGGVTLAEAFSAAVATIVNDPLPGQEEGNLRFALAHGAVAYGATPRDLLNHVNRLIQEPESRALLVQRASLLARPNAADSIVQRISSSLR